MATLDNLKSAQRAFTRAVLSYQHYLDGPHEQIDPLAAANAAADRIAVEVARVRKNFKRPKHA